MNGTKDIERFGMEWHFLWPGHKFLVMSSSRSADEFANEYFVQSAISAVRRDFLYPNNFLTSFARESPFFL